MYVYTPNIILNPTGFSQVYEDYATYSLEVGQGQLWLHFTKLLCNLTAFVIGDMAIPKFDVKEARGSMIV
jgi:glycine cleavage system pyridoxal-binding protein P